MRKEIAAEKLKGLSSTTVYQLKIELRDTKPLVWRRLTVTNDLSLWKLHEILQVVMGWMNSHLMLFHFEDKLFGRPDPEADDNWEDARRVTIRQLLQEPGDKFVYEYDFGDGWMHDITLEKVLTPEEARYSFPRCIAGENAAPPEDCGGAYGFENLKKVIGNTKNRGHEEMLTWLDSYYPNYDPKEFSLSAVNKILNLGASKYHKVISKLYE